jgi:phosphatidylserine synthase
MLWGASITFCSACAYRLARFNLIDSTTPKPKEIAKEKVDYTSSEDEEEIKKSKRSKSKFIKKMNDAMDGYITKKKFFQGVPAPVAGALALTPLVWDLYGLPFSMVDGRLLVVLNLLLVSALMTSKIPTLSSKMFMRDPRKESHLKSRSLKSLAFKIAFALSSMYMLYMHPWEVSFVSATLYYISIPVGVLIYYTTPAPTAKPH